MLHKNLFYDRLEKESEPSILPEQLKTCGRFIHEGESGDISGSSCYLCSRNPVDHRIDWFEERRK